MKGRYGVIDKFLIGLVQVQGKFITRFRFELCLGYMYTYIRYRVCIMVRLDVRFRVSVHVRSRI